jgi:hypothetical protein
MIPTRPFKRAEKEREVLELEQANQDAFHGGQCIELRRIDWNWRRTLKTPIE